MNKEYKKQGAIIRNINGRFEVEGYELTCGTPIAIRINGIWLETVIEHDEADYYAVGLKGIYLPGRIARVLG